jgi:hypothetical protein
MTDPKFMPGEIEEAHPFVTANSPTETGYFIPPGQMLAHTSTNGKYNFPVGIKDPGDTKSAAFKCPRCDAQVRRIKPGLKHLAFSCKCFVIAFHHDEKVGIRDAMEWGFVIESVKAKERTRNN